MDVAHELSPTREWGQSVERAEREPKQRNTWYDVGSGAREGVARRGGADVERAPLVENLMRFCVRGLACGRFTQGIRTWIISESTWIISFCNLPNKAAYVDYFQKYVDYFFGYVDY